ncbi:hypothetical protein A2U01_0110792 [Trifolium medium]|uniref:Uncharacterized protein n=1 Tax=Trifolium medium TaxID=97028 RepID=A0A392VPT2_9FABA|nr:hypothetical protein [Trifolium medium]
MDILLGFFGFYLGFPARWPPAVTAPPPSPDSGKGGGPLPVFIHSDECSS